ncbi:hypothetical protein TUM19329_09960 [Legionella antarctica]|uniref:Ankyrin repeats (3 copies) n=1 Tax=Legionella antarctica TaxID=2708020 RepID=A0A6F8T1V0_9GAMM|nr:hypothetical protein [Legionella antarctica]BCA94635.1 hypothetical protein TUM19329_09960 [Legionella antarctica]
MREFTPTKKNSTAPGALLRAVSTHQFLLSALKQMNDQEPGVMDQAINTASEASANEANRHWKIVVNLCKELRLDQEIIDKAFTRATAAAVKTNNWEFVIALSNLVAPARKPGRKVIDETLEIAFAEAKGSLKAVNAVRQIIACLPTDAELFKDRLEKLAKFEQKLINHELIDLVLAGQLGPIQSFVAQKHEAKPSKSRINYVFMIAASLPEGDIFKELKKLYQPDQRAMGMSLQIATRKGNLELVQFICDSYRKNELITYVKSVLQIAQDEGQTEIAGYLSSELIRQTNSLKDPFDIVRPLQQELMNHNLLVQPLQQKLITHKLLSLVSAGQLGPVQSFFAQNHAKSLSQSIVNNAFMRAASLPEGDIFKELKKLYQPDQRAMGMSLQTATRKGNLELVQFICGSYGKNELITYVKSVLQIAKDEGHKKIAGYLSCELIRQTNSLDDPLILAQTLLQDYVNHTFYGSSLFCTQVRSVNNVLVQLKRAAAFNEKDMRNQAVIDAVISLKAIMGVNQDLISRVEYIDTFSDKKDQPLEPFCSTKQP